jgi:hypothetical protein
MSSGAILTALGIQAGNEGEQELSLETWNAILDQWPTTIFIPFILVALALVILITRILDGK